MPQHDEDENRIRPLSERTGMVQQNPMSQLSQFMTPQSEDRDYLLRSAMNEIQRLSLNSMQDPMDIVDQQLRELGPGKMMLRDFFGGAASTLAGQPLQTTRQQIYDKALQQRQMEQETLNKLTDTAMQLLNQERQLQQATMSQVGQHERKAADLSMTQAQEDIKLEMDERKFSLEQQKYDLEERKFQEAINKPPQSMQAQMAQVFAESLKAAKERGIEDPEEIQKMAEDKWIEFEANKARMVERAKRAEQNIDDKKVAFMQDTITDIDGKKFRVVTTWDKNTGEVIEQDRITIGRNFTAAQQQGLKGLNRLTYGLKRVKANIDRDSNVQDAIKALMMESKPGRIFGGMRDTWSNDQAVFMSEMMGVILDKVNETSGKQFSIKELQYVIGTMPSLQDSASNFVTYLDYIINYTEAQRRAIHLDSRSYEALENPMIAALQEEFTKIKKAGLDTYVPPGGDNLLMRAVELGGFEPIFDQDPETEFMVLTGVKKKKLPPGPSRERIRPR